MQAEPERSRAARRLAERALVWLLWELRASSLRLITIGGLVPEVLTSGQEPLVPPHLGTADVDLHVAFELEAAARRDFGLLEAALERAGFVPDATARGGWRWRTRVEDVSVKVEFLCDRDNAPNQSVLAFGGRLGVLNLRGTGFVALDSTEERLRARLRNGPDVQVIARFAGLQGYLLAKLLAARERGLARDYYDLVYVLLYNRLGGPREAAAALRGGQFAPSLPSLRSSFTEVRARFHDARSVGPQSYADESLRVDPSADRPTLAADAVTAVGGFFDVLIS